MQGILDIEETLKAYQMKSSQVYRVEQLTLIGPNHPSLDILPERGMKDQDQRHCPLRYLTTTKSSCRSERQIQVKGRMLLRILSDLLQGPTDPMLTILFADSCLIYFTSSDIGKAIPSSHFPNNILNIIMNSPKRRDPPLPSPSLYVHYYW